MDNEVVMGPFDWARFLAVCARVIEIVAVHEPELPERHVGWISADLRRCADWLDRHRSEPKAAPDDR